MINTLIRPIITEKSMREAARGRFTFAVEKSAHKKQISFAVRQSFKVTPVKIQTVSVPGATHRAGKRRLATKASDWKKAIVTVKTGEKIDLFDVTDAPVQK